MLIEGDMKYQTFKVGSQCSITHGVACRLTAILVREAINVTHLVWSVIIIQGSVQVASWPLYMASEARKIWPCHLKPDFNNSSHVWICNRMGTAAWYIKASTRAGPPLLLHSSRYEKSRIFWSNQLMWECQHHDAVLVLKCCYTVLSFPLLVGYMVHGMARWCLRAWLILVHAPVKWVPWSIFINNGYPNAAHKHFRTVITALWSGCHTRKAVKSLVTASTQVIAYLYHSELGMGSIMSTCQLVRGTHPYNTRPTSALGH